MVVITPDQWVIPGTLLYQPQDRSAEGSSREAGERLRLTTDSDGNSSAEVSDEMFKDCSENNLTWVMITADGQTICSVGSNEDLLQARLVGYVYDLDQKKDKEKDSPEK